MCARVRARTCAHTYRVRNSDAGKYQVAVKASSPQLQSSWLEDVNKVCSCKVSASWSWVFLFFLHRSRHQSSRAHAHLGPCRRLRQDVPNKVQKAL